MSGSKVNEKSMGGLKLLQLNNVNKLDKSRPSLVETNMLVMTEFSDAHPELLVASVLTALHLTA